MTAKQCLFLEKLGLSQSDLMAMSRRPTNERIIEPFICKLRVAMLKDPWNPWKTLALFLQIDPLGQIVAIGFSDSIEIAEGVEAAAWIEYTLDDMDENLIFSKEGYWLQIDHENRIPDELVDRIRLGENANNSIPRLTFQVSQESPGNSMLSELSIQDQEGAGLALMQVFEDDLRQKIFEFRTELKSQGIDSLHYAVAIRSGMVDISVAIASDEFYLRSFPSIADMRDVVINSVKVMFKVSKGVDAPALDTLDKLLSELFEAVFDAQSVDSLEYLTCLFDSVWYEIDFSRASMVVESIFQRKLLAKNMQKIMTNV